MAAMARSGTPGKSSALPSPAPAPPSAPGNGATAQTAPLTAWLEAHGLSYDVAGYWDASVICVQSGDKVRIRAIDLHRTTSAAGWKVNEPYWETNALWYDPSRYDARFVIADTRGIFSRTALKRFFGKPSATYRVANPAASIADTSAGGLMCTR